MTDKNQELVIAEPRLPMPVNLAETHPEIDSPKWRALVEAVFPLAESAASVVLALDYCKARNLDVFKRVVYIVPMWNSKLNRKVETIWPGIAELSTTAFRTNQYAGKEATEFGPDIELHFEDGTYLTVPEWAMVTVYRMQFGQRIAYAGFKVYWQEFYASASHNTDVPNAMWKTKKRYMIEKCALASALRAAFPEELGETLAAEEVRTVLVETEGGSTVETQTTPRPNRSGARQAAAIATVTLRSINDDEITIVDDPSAINAEMRRLIDEAGGAAGMAGVNGLFESNADALNRHDLDDLYFYADKFFGDEQSERSVSLDPDSLEVQVADFAKTITEEGDAYFKLKHLFLPPKKTTKGDPDWQGWVDRLMELADKAPSKAELERLRNDNRNTFEEMKRTKPQLAKVLAAHFKLRSEG